MDIQTLRVFISEQDMMDLALKLMPPDAPVKKFAVSVTAEGVRVTGEMPTPMLTMPFESVWQPAVADGKLAAKLVNLSAGGFPATPFRTLVLGLLKDTIKEPFVQVVDDTVVVDVQDFVKRQDPPVRVVFELQAVRCIDGGVIAEAGLPPPKAG